MLKVIGMIAAAMTAVAVSAPAKADSASNSAVTQVVAAFQNAAIVNAAAFSGIEWKVNDKTSSKMSNILLNGTVDAFVREDIGTSIWVQQDMNLAMAGKQKLEILMNKSTGAIEKLLVNGKEEKAPAPNVEVVEMKESNMTVPAGTFDCIYAKIKNKDDGKITEAWMNPKLVPMSGQLKVVAESQFGQLIQELTSFQFAPR